ncbi:MAG: hypothetical protein Q7W29_09530 [bacterium]|nr:hypothetical protein [bacterium]
MRGCDRRLGRGRRSPPSRPALVRAAPLFLIAWLALLGAAGGAAAGDLILWGLDPLLRSTDDPRLLGEDRLVLRERMLALGFDPVGTDSLSRFDRRLRYLSDAAAGADWKRRVTVTESSGPLGIETVFSYPEYFLLTQSPRELPGGFVYYPPRDTDAPEVELFIDDQAAARERRLAVRNRVALARDLDLRGGAGGAGTQTGLINLTIPIKLPRTLEKIIGRGEKTNIRISGREHISIAGESTLSNHFVQSERRRSQSLFPSLDMEQQLQINLSGQIGEKIKLEVDHNSEGLGPEATKIRLTFEGTEDEIIQTIETGDVGLTLPGSQLLGYSSNASGLFGLKVTGQFGPADFTVLATKQKAESAGRTFNSSGGSQTEHVIYAYQYLNNRFFRLDLPPNDIVAHRRPDVPGRDRQQESIDLGSVQVFLSVTGRQQDGDIRNIVAVTDTTGLWSAETVGAALPGGHYGELWRPVNFEIIRDQNDELVAIDLLREYGFYDVLAVIYEVILPDGTRRRVGDKPGVDETNRVEYQGELYYRMKMLKPQNPEPYTWQYVLRNIYPLGGSNIDAASFDLRLETTLQTNYPEQDLDNTGAGSGLKWIRIFGLDRTTPQNVAGHDDRVDAHDPYLFDLTRGLLKFPLDFPEPFNAAPEVYEAFADSSVYDPQTTLLDTIPQIYSTAITPQQMTQYTQYRFVATHAAASSTFNLGASNIEEGSETVTLDGRTLVRDTDYVIDYSFGEVTLKGEAAANMTADSRIAVNYQFAPFVGGGNSSLMGFNLGMDVGRDGRFATTWLYESNAVVGHKAKLGEEPSRTLVGNLNGQVTVRPGVLTGFANLLSRHDSDRESNVRLTGELALSVPNPNTFNEVYVEDYEGVDSSDLLPVNRLAWSAASVPAHGTGLSVPPGDPRAYLVGREFTPQGRLDTRWFLPREITQRRYLNPELREQEARESQQVLQIHLSNGGEAWTPESWGGITHGLGRNGVDLTKAQFLEFWVNDFRHEALGTTPDGTLHFDFGYINEDGYWPVGTGGALETGTYQREDGVMGDAPDGIWEIREDVGLGNDAVRDRFNADFGTDGDPYPWINGTAGNNREDSEDLDGDSILDDKDGFFTISVDLADSAMVDVLRDFPPSEVTANLDQRLSWRKYRIRLGDRLPVVPPGGITPQLATATHLRIWFENRDPAAAETVRDIQLTEIKLLGTRWEREGVRRVPSAAAPDELLLTPADLAAGEEFFLGEVNNKENPDYAPPFALRIENQVQEKETSLVLDYQNLQRQHMVRASRLISPQGEDFTRYERLLWYVFNPDPDQADMEVFYRVGADTLNYYEISYRFDESDGARSGWQAISLDLAELSNAKLDARDPVSGWIVTRVRDSEADRDYRVRVVGSPDLRRVKRFYLGVRNTDRSAGASGYFYFNDVRLQSVRREMGFAERIAMSVNMADIIKTDFDWSRRDAEFHGLSSDVGQGYTNEDWNLTSSFRVDDFVPLLGYRVPVSLGRQSGVRRPKYVTNSDIEIIDEALRERESSRNERESFSVRVTRAPSVHPLLRYFVDPWTVGLSGSRSGDETPLAIQRGKNLQGSLTYDLRIAGDRKLETVPLLGRVPLLRSVGLLPSKVTFSGNYSATERRAQNYNVLTGIFEARPTQRTRTGALTGSFSYRPLPIVDLDFTARSDRDPLRPQEALGFNFGQENVYAQQVQLRFQPPQRLEAPAGWWARPLDLALRASRSLRPTLNFNGSFSDNHSPSVRQTGDPPGISNIQNSGDWTVRLSLPIDGLVNRLVPRRSTLSRDEQGARLRQQAEQARRQQGGGGTGGPAATGEPAGTEEPGAVGVSSATPVRDPRLDDPNLTDEERRAIEEEALLRRAEDEARDEQERRERRERERTLAAPALADSATVAAAAAADTAAAAPAPGRRWRVPNPLPGFLEVLRETQPVQVNYSRKKQASYGRFTGNAPFWYRVGFYNDYAAAESLYVSHGLSDQTALTMSTSTKLGRMASLDVNYSRTVSEAEQAGLVTESYNRDWPDLRFSLTGLERLGLLGGGGTDGLLRSANLQVNYKFTRNVPNITATQYNPRESSQITPRLNFTFQNGMSASLNVGSSVDRSEQTGSLSSTGRFNVNVQLRHQFRAEKLLSRLGLYKPGAQPNINMDIDISMSRDTTERWFAGSDRAGEPDQSTGTSRWSFNPRFSYQLSRNLSGALRFIYSRDTVKETDLVTQRFGLGLEATFVF